MTHKKSNPLLENRTLKALLLSSALEESGAPRIVLRTIATISLIFALMLVWATFTQIPEVTSAAGVVVPKGQIPVVQHLEGGIVANVLVNDGDTVVKDQPIMMLSPTIALTELKKLQTKEVALEIDLLRLDAFIQNKDLSQQTILDQIPRPEEMNEIDYKVLMQNALSLLQQQRITNEREYSILKTQASQLRQEISNLQSRKVNLNERKENLAQQVQIHESGTKTKISSKLQLLQATDRFKNVQTEVLQLEQDMSDNKSSLAEAQDRLENFEAKRLEDAYKERSEVNQSLLEVKDSLQAAQDKTQRLAVRSPVNGIVKGLNIDVGTVIQPGGVLFEVVPIDESLVVEAKVLPKEIGHMSVGDKVKVKVSAFNFSRYGQLDGEVLQISASTFSDEKGNSYYKALIQLDKAYLGQKDEKHLLLPGMTVTADIITGNKSLLSYLIKPVKISLDTAFRER